MDAAPGGMPGPRTCTPPFPNPSLIVVVFCRCWSNGFVSSGLHEPPYTEPYVRWCGRTAEVTPPPTRLRLASGYLRFENQVCICDAVADKLALPTSPGPTQPCPSCRHSSS